MATNTQANHPPFWHRHETFRSTAEQPLSDVRGRGGRNLLTVFTGALVGVTIGLAALAAYVVIDSDGGGGTSGTPQAPAPDVNDPDTTIDVTDISLFSEAGVASSDPRSVVQSILTGGGYGEGWTSSALYESEDLTVVAFTHPNNPPGSEFLNMYRLVLADDGLWHAYPGYDAVNGLYGTAEDALIAYALKNHPGAAINVAAEELPDGASSVSWTVVSDSAESRTYEISASGSEPVTVVINKVTEIDAESGAEIQGWRGTPPELFPF